MDSFPIPMEFVKNNIGMINMEGREADALLRLKVRDGKGAVVLQQRVKLSELATK